MSTTTTTVNANPSTYDAPSGIADDCSSDVTPALVAWIASVPDNSVLRFAPDACYEIENVLMIEGRHRLTFLGNGATFMAKTDGTGQPPPPGVNDKSWPRRRAQWWIRQSTGITLTNMTIIGANPYTGLVDAQYNPNYEVQSGVVVNGSNGVTIADSTISKVWGDFVTIENDSSNVTIRNNRMTTTGRQGIAITKASHVLIDGNTMDDVRWGMFDIEPNGSSGVVDDVHIVNNVSGNARWIWLASWGPSTLVSNIVVEHNTVTGRSLTLVYVNNTTPAAGLRGPFTIAHNDLQLTPGWLAAFELVGAKQVSIHDNVVRPVPTTTMTMVHASHSDQLQVRDNDFTGAAKIMDQGDTPTWCEVDNLPAALSQNKPC